MNHLIFIIALFNYQDIPFKPSEEFEIKLDYQFKQRPFTDHNTVNLSESQKEHNRKASTGVLPYLVLNVKLLKLPGDKSRMRITTNRNDRPILKKVSLNTVISLDLGFTVDMIDRVKAHEYTLTIFDDDKNPIDRILISVGEDGSFFVNGELRGKF